METLMITIEEAHVSPVTSDVTGQVNGGHMGLKATTLLPTRLHRVQPHEDMPNFGGAFEVEVTGKRFYQGDT